MNHKSFLNFLFLLIFKHKNKHIAIFFISIILVFILSSVIFVKTVLKHDALITLDAQSDFVVQKISSGRGVDTLQDWADDFLDIAGVTNTNARVYGKYWYEPNERYFYIIGVDLYEDQIIKNLKKIDKELSLHLKQRDINEVGSVEKAILRLSIYEIKFSTLPKAIIINEAIELAKKLTSNNAPKFINGLLDKVQK